MRFVKLFISATVLGLSALAADVNQKKVDQIFAAYDRPDSAGCALGVIQDGNFVYRRGYGTASLELAVSLSPESVFYLGSVSKQFTAASVVLASEQGALSLDDNVRKYIPELPDYSRAITLRQMLHHTSGFRDFETLLYLSGRHDADLHSEQEMVNLIARQKSLNNVPGDEFIYSNSNYFLLGVVIKRATKKTLAEFAAENIFRPLGMTHTRFYDDHTLVVHGRVPAYAAGKNNGFVVNWSTNFDLVGAGGLMSSVDDLLLWDRNFNDNRLGKGTLLTEMLTPGVLNNGKKINYALGLELGTYRGLRTIDHEGALFGYRTGILRFPDRRFTVVCLCNLSNANVLPKMQKVADVYLSDKLQPAATATAPSGDFPDPSRFAGKYFDPRRHFVYSFTASGKNLIGWGAALRRIGPNQFKDLGTGTITFEESATGMTARLDLDDETFFSGTKIPDIHLSEGELAAYAGRYRSTELEATYEISVQSGVLSLHTDWNPPLTFAPVASDEFSSEAFGTLVFDRDANHRVSTLRVFSVNARNILFEKID